VLNFLRPRVVPKVLILDVDGVLTDRRFLYGENGKTYKLFGADDHDAIRLISKFISVIAVTADKQGFAISKRRISKDFGIVISIVPSKSRVEWIADRYNPQEVIYIGDGFYDSLIFKTVGYGIAPKNALKHTRDAANYVTDAVGGEGAVAEACIHILHRFFKKTIEDVHEQ
jgi:3-deoxy-D-manno-octulosonate 8-phosphate phosphatase (KDO 8-P phosphatase)